MTSEELSKLVSIADTCRILGLSRTTVDKFLGNGKLERVKIGRRALVTRESIDRFVASL